MTGQGVVAGQYTITVDGATFATAQSIEIDIGRKIESIKVFGVQGTLKYPNGNDVVLKLTKVHVDDTYWDKFQYSSYTNYSKDLGTTTIVWTNIVSNVTKTHTATLTNPKITKWGLKGELKNMMMEEMEISATAITIATA